MLHQISSNTLAFLDPESKKVELDAFVDGTRSTNGSASAYLEAKIKAFEDQFQTTSEDLIAKLSCGEIEETEDVASWLFYIDALRAHAG